MLFAGLTSVIAKFGMKNLSSDVALSIRTTVVLIIAITNALLFTNAFIQIKQVPKSNVIYLAISGIITSLSWIFYYWAIKEEPLYCVASINKASIAVTLLLSFLILKEPLTIKIIAGATFILIKMIILIWKWKNPS